ncbi:hypothetical protein A2Z33_03840 [Candidatus Gottesmanbacteria bacterium RBG_16_52_11]|uniref:Glycosyltransferase RgtA/B/C/D-like domain-containing protein n=1 Tax=Candidatus Gottesmanbacteria bacterium RBG_16_52_11 TaxID=1798374 RepID=A0A1F5YVZ8_9BACT|nr:MAG: hypothetical protein A2Z33_03840 [Candidatus Gottesmanbacteria bacterium RBG_16_52_11]
MKLFRRIPPGFIIYFIICQALFTAANIPFYKRVSDTPPEQINPLVHKGPTDYFTYLTFIRESRDGAWQVPALYTTEPTQPSAIYVYYIAVGKAARIFSLSPVAAYHISRLVAAELFFLSVYLVAAALAGKRLAPWAALVGLFSTAPLLPFGKAVLTDAQQLRTAGSWWYNLDPVFRADWVPHHHFGVALMLLSIYTMIRWYSVAGRRLPVTAIGLAFVSSLTYPTTALVLLLWVPVTIWGIRGIREIRGEKRIGWESGNVKRITAGAVCIAAAAGAGLLITTREIGKGFPWSQWASWDIAIWNQQPNFERDFLLSGGLVLLAALPFALKELVKPRRLERVFAATWLITPYLLIPFANALGIAKIRFGFLSQFLPAGVFAVMAVSAVLTKISRRPLRILTLAALLGIFAWYTYPSTEYFYNWSAYIQQWEAPQTRIPRSIAEAVKYLAKNGEPHTTVLSDAAAGLILPAFAPVRVYYGHEVHTYDFWGKKRESVVRFYQVAMQEDEAAAFLRANDIRYVFYGPSEKSWGAGYGWYRSLPLRTWYQSQDVTVFEVY